MHGCIWQMKGTPKTDCQMRDATKHSSQQRVSACTSVRPHPALLTGLACELPTKTFRLEVLGGTHGCRLTEPANVPALLLLKMLRVTKAVLLDLKRATAPPSPEAEFPSAHPECIRNDSCHVLGSTAGSAMAHPTQLFL